MIVNWFIYAEERKVNSSEGTMSYVSYAALKSENFIEIHRGIISLRKTAFV